MSKHNNFSIEKAKQQVTIIRNTLPGYMVPGFVRLVNENSEKDWFIEFINLYADFVKDAVDKKIDIISPATALNEYMKKFEKPTEEAVELSEPEATEYVIADDAANEAVQDEVSDEPGEDEAPEELATVDDVYDEELEVLADEPQDII